MISFTINSVQRLGPRDGQEDRVITLRTADGKYCCVGVSDGVGGQEYGEYASEIALIAVADAFYASVLSPYQPSVERIAFDCVVKAHNRVLQLGRSLRLGKGKLPPAATAVVSIIRDCGEIGTAWMGDSPAILLDGKSIIVPAIPHNVSMDAEYAAIVPGAVGPELTRFLGESQFGFGPETDIRVVSQTSRLLLMSDGAFGVLEPFLNAFDPSKDRFVDILKNAPESALRDNASLVEVDICPAEKGGAVCQRTDDTRQQRS